MQACPACSLALSLSLSLSLFPALVVPFCFFLFLSLLVLVVEVEGSLFPSLSSFFEKTHILQERVILSFTLVMPGAPPPWRRVGWQALSAWHVSARMCTAFGGPERQFPGLPRCCPQTSGRYTLYCGTKAILFVTLEVQELQHWESDRSARRERRKSANSQFEDEAGLVQTIWKRRSCWRIQEMCGQFEFGLEFEIENDGEEGTYMT